MKLSGGFRGVDTPWQHGKLDLHSCLPCLPSGRHVPEAGVTGRHCPWSRGDRRALSLEQG